MSSADRMLTSKHSCANQHGRVAPFEAIEKNTSATRLDLDFESDWKSFHYIELQSDLNKRLPLPSKLKRSQSMPAVPEDTRCYTGAIFSLAKPYKISAASPEFLQAVKLSLNQVYDRSITVLLKPQSDAESFAAAIENASRLQSTALRMSLHSSDGRDLDVTASFSPYRGPSDDAPGGCLLQIECIHDAESEPALPVFLLDDFGTRGADGCAGERQLRLLREARRATGLDNERERLRQLARSAWKRAASTY